MLQKKLSPQNGSKPEIQPSVHGQSSGRRTALAKWITNKQNPLTARVMANRLWQHHFGSGIIATSNNFGAGGLAPSNPELLDYLANEFKNGIELDRNVFHGGGAPGAANNFLRKLGFKIVGGGTHEYKTLLKPKDVFTNNELMKFFEVSNSGGMRFSKKNKHLVLISDYTKGLYDDRWEDALLHYTGEGKIGDQSFMLIGQQKGFNTKTRQYRNFGMANPEGYRKALRLMKSAEKFNLPVVCFIDTPGAYPGLEAEERGQGEAIARNILEMTRLKVPIIVVIIGEGASGGALGIGVGDKVLMLENTWYSVISPESCSSILWRSWEYKEQAAEALKLTATDMKKLKLIDEIVREPAGGAHANRDKTFTTVKNKILSHYKQLEKLSPKELVDSRMEKYAQMGVFNG